MRPVDPIDVPGKFVNFAEKQPEYLLLPARVKDGVVYTRWRLSFVERLWLFLGRSIDLEVLTFNRPLQPLLLYVEGMKSPEKEAPMDGQSREGEN